MLRQEGPSVLHVQGSEWKEGVRDVLGSSITSLLEQACKQPAGEWVTLLGTRTGERLCLCPQEDSSHKIQAYSLTRLTDIIAASVQRGGGKNILRMEQAGEESP